MINQQLFTPLSLSRRLKRANYNQDTVFYWYEHKTVLYISTPSLEIMKEGVDQIKLICSAYTAEELGRLFPPSVWLSPDITTNKRKECFFYFIRKGDRYIVQLLIKSSKEADDVLEVKRFEDISEVTVRGEMLMFLKKSQYI